jgi:hypothetical protein
MRSAPWQLSGKNSSGSFAVGGGARGRGRNLIVPVRAKVGDLASIYSFNGTGTLIWKLLETPRTLEEIAAAVVRKPTKSIQRRRNKTSSRICWAR